MNLTFEYKGKLYQIELNDEQITRYTSFNFVKADVLIADKEFVRVEWLFDKHDNKVRKTSVFGMREFNIPKLIDKRELEYQKLLAEYGLDDDTQSRLLWDKCYELNRAYGDPQVDYFHQLVELIQN